MVIVLEPCPITALPCFTDDLGTRPFCGQIRFCTRGVFVFSDIARQPTTLLRRIAKRVTQEPSEPTSGMYVCIHRKKIYVRRIYETPLKGNQRETMIVSIDSCRCAVETIR